MNPHAPLTKRDLTVLHDALARSYNARTRAAKRGRYGTKRPSEVAMELAEMKGTLDRVSLAIDTFDQELP